MISLKHTFSLRRLHWQALWLGLGALLLGAFLYLSLVRVSLPNLGVSHVDKWLHFFAYFSLTVWACQLLFDRRSQWLAGALLLLIGLGVECLQSLTSYRSAEWHDLLANTLGIVTALLLCSTGLDRSLQVFERGVLSLLGR